LKRLNAIFERAADRRSGGIREDKILRILPSGTATKYGIDPEAVRRRLQLRREWQEENRRISATVAMANGGKSNRRRRRKSSRSQQRDASIGEGETSVTIEQGDISVEAREALACLGPCPELQILSRGTFLAMFANESSTFVNTMAQNDRTDRERRSARRNNDNSAGKNPGGSANAGLGGSDIRLQVVATGTPALHISSPSMDRTVAGSTSLGLANVVLGEMTNHHPSNNLSSQPSSTVGQQRYRLIPEINSSPSTDLSAPGNADEIRPDIGREEKAERRGRRSRSGRSGSDRSDKNRRRVTSSNGITPMGVHFDYYNDVAHEDDASISSLSTTGSAGRGTGERLDRHRFGHRRTESMSTLSSVGGDSVDRGLNRSLSHDQEYFTNELFASGNEDLNVLSPESCSGSLADYFGFSPELVSPQPNHYQAHHSADAAAGGFPASPRTDLTSLTGELQKPKAIGRSKSDSSKRSNRGKKKRSGDSESMKSRRSLDDHSSVGSGSYQSGGKLIGQSPSTEERKAMRRERRRRKEQRRKAELQLERKERELTAASSIGTSISAAQHGHVLAHSDSQQYHQSPVLSPALPIMGTPERLLSPVHQREAYSCGPKDRNEDENECVFFSSICNLLQKYIPVFASNKKVLVRAVPSPQHDAYLSTQVPNVPGVVLPSSTCQQTMIIGLTRLGQPTGGHHRRAASLTNTASDSPAHKFYVRHQRTNSIDGRLPLGYHQQQQEFVGIVPLATVAAPPSTPDLAGLAFLGTPHKSMVPPPVLSSAGSSRSASPLDLRGGLSSSLQALAQNDPGLHQNLSSAASFSSVSSHSTNGSAPLAGELVVIA
jgi:hypothetical protein